MVVCGVPNVGKSSFIRLATSGKPDVASYPFTTKSLIFGHRNLGYLKIQFVDTPGLLDRPLDERNEIELQAIAALKHLSDVMVILVDISSNASSSLEEQVNLINDIDMYYPASEIIIAITKSDLLNEIQIEQTAKVLAELDISNHPIQIIHTKNHKGIKQILGVLEILISTRIIKSDKFKSSFEMEIHPDFLDDEDEFGY